MSRWQRLLLVYILLKLREPRVVQKVTKLYAGGGGITEAQAIAAVEGEATLDLTGDVSIDGDLKFDGVTSKIKHRTSDADPYTANIEWDETLWGFKVIDSDGSLVDFEAVWLHAQQLHCPSILVENQGSLALRNVIRHDVASVWELQAALTGQAAKLVSQLYWKTTEAEPYWDLNLGGDLIAVDGTKAIFYDLINEKSAAAGVTIDGLLVKDGDITAFLKADGSRDLTGDWLVGLTSGNITIRPKARWGISPYPKVYLGTSTYPFYNIVTNSMIASSFRLNNGTFYCDTNYAINIKRGGAAGTIVLKISNDGVSMPDLPVADPHVVGVLWNNGGAVTVSAG